MRGSLASSENPFRDPPNGMSKQTPKAFDLSRFSWSYETHQILSLFTLAIR
jgi:hypothetical protein